MQAYVDHVEHMHDPLKAMLDSISEEVAIQYPKDGMPVVNAEPLIGDHGITRHIVESLCKGVPVYDFDRRNVELLNSLGYCRAYWRPCLWTEGLQAWVDKVPDQTRIYDITHIGIPTGRREFVINEIQKRGIKVNIVNGLWGKDAIKALKQSMLVINIHREGALQAQEALRISWALACGCLVVSETSLFPSIPEPCIIESDIGKLAEKTIESLGDHTAKERLEIFKVYSLEVIKKTWLKSIL